MRIYFLCFSSLIPENWQLTLFIVSVFIVLFTLNRRVMNERLELSYLNPPKIDPFVSVGEIFSRLISLEKWSGGAEGACDAAKAQKWIPSKLPPVLNQKFQLDRYPLLLLKVYNILPQHVAAHFLGSRKRKHEELYSQSYSEVGILFASMPNFSGKNFKSGHSIRVNLKHYCDINKYFQTFTPKRVWTIRG